MGAIAKDSTLSGVINSIVSISKNGVQRHTSNKMVTIINQQPTSTSGISNSSDPLSLDGVALCSLRIANNLKDSSGNAIGFKLRVNQDLVAADGSASGYLYDTDGNEVIISLPARNVTYIVTPDDIPAMKYLSILSVRIIPDVAPTSGSIKVHACLKA